MQEQSPDEEQREREEGRADPEELLRRYGLRDREHGLRYEGSLLHPPTSALWG